jgi:O-antigen/teichoic acid export membrane protein
VIKKILNNSLWLLIGSSIGRLSIFLVNIIAARILPQEIFGQFMMLRSTISSIEAIVSGSLGSSVIKKVASSKKEELHHVLIAIFLTNTVIAIFLSMLIVFFSPFLVKYFFMGNLAFINILYLGIFILIPTTLATMIQNILIGFEQYKILAYSSILSSSISFPITYIFILYFHLKGVIIGIGLYFSIDFGIKLFNFFKLYTDRELFNLKKVFIEIKKIIVFSFPLLFTVIIVSVSFWYIRVLTINDSHSFKTIAIFDAAFQWLSIITLITSVITSSVLPALSKNLENTFKLKKIFKINIVVNLFISIFMASIFIFFSKNIMSLYGDDYTKGYLDLVYLSVASVFFTVATIYNRYMISTNNLWVIAIVTVISAFVLFLTYFMQVVPQDSNLSLSVLMYYLTSSILYCCIKIYFDFKGSKCIK